MRGHPPRLPLRAVFASMGVNSSVARADPPDCRDLVCLSPAPPPHQPLRLRALKAHVVGGTVFFVVMHPDKKRWENGEVSDPMAVHLWAVGVSPASGNLIGAHGTQACHNLCD